MLDFDRMVHENLGLDELTGGLHISELRVLTTEMISTIEDLIKDCNDQDLTFEPEDPIANDPFAATQQEVKMAWNLGHVIVHITASAEESAALAAELARGVQYHGRSRYEVPWIAMDTIEKCRHRLAESRRMRLASLDMWPDDPDLANQYQVWAGGPTVNAIGRFVLGLKHDFDHLEQIKAIVIQAHRSRM